MTVDNVSGTAAAGAATGTGDDYEMSSEVFENNLSMNMVKDYQKTSKSQHDQILKDILGDDVRVKSGVICEA